MHYGLRAVIFEQNNHEMFNFESWFLCHISSNTGFFGRGSFYSPKIGKPKNNITNINLGSVRLKKREWGRNFRFYRCYGISFYNFCNKHPLMGKTLLNSEKNALQISHLMFWMLQAAKFLICVTRVPLILLSKSVSEWVS